MCSLEQSARAQLLPKSVRRVGFPPAEGKPRLGEGALRDGVAPLEGKEPMSWNPMEASKWLVLQSDRVPVREHLVTRPGNGGEIE